MSDFISSTNPLDIFYKQLIKSSLPLSVRNHLGDILASSYRSHQNDEWINILNRQSEFAKPLSSLRENGYLPLQIPFASQLAADLCSLESLGEADDGPGGRKETVTLQNVSSLGLVQKLINDHSLYHLVSLYLGAPASLHTCQAWWQYPMGPSHKPSNAQLWHRDRDDLSELKLFFYGTDVDIDSGPHAYLPKSHTHQGLTSLFPSVSLHNPVLNGSKNSFVDDSFFTDLGLKAPVKKWLGSAGTCFLEDTRGFHRAYIPTKFPRLLFSLVWTVGPGF